MYLLLLQVDPSLLSDFLDKDFTQWKQDYFSRMSHYAKDKNKIILKAKKYLKKYSLKDTVDLIFEIEKINKKEIYQLCLKVKNEKDY